MSASASVVAEGGVWKGKPAKSSGAANAADTDDEWPGRWERRYLVLTETYLALSEGRAPGESTAAVIAGSKKMRIREIVSVVPKPKGSSPADAFRTREDKDRRKKAKDEKKADAEKPPTGDGGQAGEAPKPAVADGGEKKAEEKTLWPLIMMRDDGAKFTLAWDEEADFDVWHASLVKVMGKDKERAEKRAKSHEVRVGSEMPGSSIVTNDGASP